MNNSYVHHFNYGQWQIHRELWEGGGGVRVFKTKKFLYSTHNYSSLIWATAIASYSWE